MESKRVADLSFYPRGMPELCKHVAHKIRSRRLDSDVYEVALTGTQIKTCEDLQVLKRIVRQFHDPICVRLNKMGLREIDWLVQLLCTWKKNKKLDVAGNDIPAKEMEKLVRALETRRKGYWLAIGTNEDLKPLLTTPTSCHPHSWRGCLCRDKRTVHVIEQLRPFSKTEILQWEATHLHRTRRTPPLTPPPYIKGYVDTSLKLASAVSLLKKLQRADEDAAIKEGRAFEYKGQAYHIMTDGDNYIMANLCDVSEEGARTIEGERVQLERLCPPLRAKGPMFLATAAPFTIEMNGFLRTNGGELLIIPFDVFKRASDGRGWVAAAAKGDEYWRWFPLECVLPP